MGVGEQALDDPPGKGQGTPMFTTKTVPMKAPGASSEAVIDDDDDDDHMPQALSRTKSQLTLLLERDRGVNQQEKRKGKQQPRKTSS